MVGAIEMSGDRLVNVVVSHGTKSSCYSYFRTRLFPDEWPLLETLIFFEISHGSHQHFDFSPYLGLSTQ